MTLGASYVMFGKWWIQSEWGMAIVKASKYM